MSRTFKRDFRIGVQLFRIKVPDSQAGRPGPRDNPQRRGGVGGKFYICFSYGMKPNRARLERRILRREVSSE